MIISPCMTSQIWIIQFLRLYCSSVPTITPQSQYWCIEQLWQVSGCCASGNTLIYNQLMIWPSVTPQNWMYLINATYIAPTALKLRPNRDINVKNNCGKRQGKSLDVGRNRFNQVELSVTKIGQISTCWSYSWRILLFWQGKGPVWVHYHVGTIPVKRG